MCWVVNTPGGAGARFTVLVVAGGENHGSSSRVGTSASQTKSRATFVRGHRGGLNPVRLMAGVTSRPILRKSGRGECCTMHVLLMTRVSTVARMSLKPCRRDHSRGRSDTDLVR